MKQAIIILISVFVYMGISCKKNAQPLWEQYDKSTVDIELLNGKQVTEDGQINISSTDSVIAKITIECPYTELVTYGVQIMGIDNFEKPKEAVTPGHKLEFIYKIYAKDLAQGVGLTSFRFFGLDKAGLYWGDGGKRLTINVIQDFATFTNRVIYLSDVAMQNACFVSLKADGGGKVYNYTEAAANAADVDFYLTITRVDTSYKYDDSSVVKTPPYPKRDTTVTWYPWVLTSPGSAVRSVIPGYNMSSWATKNITLFSSKGLESDYTEAVLRSKYNTWPKILKEATTGKTYLKDMILLTPFAQRDTFRVDKLREKGLYVKRQDGKYALIVMNIGKLTAGGAPYLNITWRTEY
ncbi:MAG TPA: hypothetical protein VGE79_12685 [Niastella sp.]